MNLVLRSRNGFPTPFAFRRASHGSLDRLFDSMVEDFFASPRASTAAAGIAPRINLSERADAYVLEADLPGVAKENVKISVDGNVVTLEAEIKRGNEHTGERKEGETVIYAERSVEKFARSITLSSEVDDEKSAAKLENGVLTLTLPKKAELLPKQIQVQ